MVLSLAPTFLGLIGESSVPAVAHLGVSPRHERGYVFEAGVSILAKLKQHLIFFFGPGLLGLLIALL